MDSFKVFNDEDCVQPSTVIPVHKCNIPQNDSPNFILYLRDT